MKKIQYSQKIFFKTPAHPIKKWYQFKVPVTEFEKAVGSIEGFNSIRFMRVFMKGFTDSTILRFGQLQLVRADWRRYLQSLNTPGAVVPLDPTDATTFVVSTVTKFL